MAVILAILDESREIVIEGEVDDAVGPGGAFFQAVRIGNRPAVNLGASIAGAGYPTLLVDLDPQCNATVALGLA